METDLEKVIDEIANRAKKGRDISVWQNHRQFAPIANLLSKLSSFPKSVIPIANFTRIKNQILDRISVPEDMKVISEHSGFWMTFPSMLKIASGVLGMVLIVVSLGIGTAVAALQSVPGQPIYPLKKIVENIQLKLTSDPSAKANLQIQFANNRLDELTSVIDQTNSGEISAANAQKIVAQTVSNLQKATAAINTTSANPANSKPKASTLTKLVDLSNKQTAVLKPLLTAASISDEGDVKAVLEQALETSSVTKEEAIKNIESAGLQVEDQPIDLNSVSASGEITTLSTDAISISTAKFLLTKDTKYVNIKSTDLKVGVKVQVSGEVRDDKKTYALTISAVDNSTTTPDTQTNTTTKPTDTQSQPGTTVKP
jgi:hypothetical protein